MTRTFTTNLRCGACVAKIQPAFDAAGLRIHADLESPQRTLTVDGDAVSSQQVHELMAAAGYEAIEAAAPIVQPEEKTSYVPLLILIGYLLGITLLIEATAGRFDAMRWMANFMAGFFLAFSFFKMLDVRGFADSYAMYDLLARRSRLYALAYPFLELSLGIAYLTRFSPTLTNAVTLALMLVGTAGIIESLMNKRRVKCACLGSVFNLPMSYVTLMEDVTMAVMAAAMLLA